MLLINLFYLSVMSDEPRHRLPVDEEENGPGTAYRMFEMMSNLSDKLKLLNYEEHFLKKYNIKFLSRHYFAIPTNPGEQFFLFTTLSAWLINVAGKNFEMPQESDDPNATVSRIMEELKRFSISADFPPSKLKTGSGEYVCFVLDKLATTALHSVQFSWGKPIYPYEEEAEEEEMHGDDGTELQLNKLDEDDDLEVVDESDDEGVGPILDLNKTSQQQDKPARLDVMYSSTNADDWRLEVERVTPLLKVNIKSDHKDWRVHVDQMRHHQKGIETSLAVTKPQLDKLRDEIYRTFEKIGSREKYINNQLEQYVQEFRNAQDHLAQAKEKYKQGSGGVTEHSQTLADITEELEKVKMDMEERGNSMTDGAPLVRIKQTLNSLKVECIQMDIRIGVIEHVLMQARLRDRNLMHKDMNKEVAMHGRLSHLDVEDDHSEKSYFGNI